jgi:branched-chain amino acid transport system substrate-binding protein
VPIHAAVMVATTRAAAKFIEKTHDLFPGMIYSNMSSVGASSLSDELMLLGPRFTQGAIVTQTVPAVSGYSSAVLDDKNALAKYFPSENADYMSLEGFISTNVLIDALRRCGPQIETERLVDILENVHGLDLGIVRCWASAARAPGLPQGLGHGARPDRQVSAARTRMIASHRFETRPVPRG